MTLVRDQQILDRTRLRRERVLPVAGEVLVKQGQAVGPDTIVAKAETLPGDPYVIDLKNLLRRPLTPAEVVKVMLKRVGERVTAGEPLAQMQKGRFGEVVQVKSPVDGVIEFISRAYGRVLIRENPQSAAPVVVVPVARRLGVWPATLRMYMRFREGDEVKQGVALADSPGMMGMDYAYAPISGIIEKIDTRTGAVTIVRPAKPTVIEAYLGGVVESVVEDHGAVISCNASYLQGVFGVGFEGYGYLRVPRSSSGEGLTADDLNGELRDQVLVAGGRVTLPAVRKAAAAGARGVVCGGMDHQDLVEYVGQEIGVGITGQEDVPLTIVLTEGFGEMPMAEETFALLRGHEGRLVSLNGSTQVRAGVIRPEVIIPVDAGTPSGPAPMATDELDHALPDLAVGVRVRALRKPYFGLWGEVIELPAEPLRFETEAVVRAVRLRLDDGREALIPLANVELAR